MTVTIKTTATELARAYFGGRISGSVYAPEGMTSEGRSVRFIRITKGSHNVTLSGKVGGRKWHEVYNSTSVPIDD